MYREMRTQCGAVKLSGTGGAFVKRAARSMASHLMLIQVRRD